MNGTDSINQASSVRAVPQRGANNLGDSDCGNVMKKTTVMNEATTGTIDEVTISAAPYVPVEGAFCRTI